MLFLASNIPVTSTDLELIKDQLSKIGFQHLIFQITNNRRIMNCEYYKKLL